MFGFRKSKKESTFLSATLNNKTHAPLNRKAKKTTVETWKEKKSRWKKSVEGFIVKLRKIGRIASKTVITLILLGGVLGGGYQIKSWVQSSSAFLIQDVLVEGNRYLSDSQVLHIAGIKEDSHAFSISTSEIEMQLQQQPWISTAKVIRKLPDSLEIHLEEFEPVALLQLDMPHLVSIDGFVFKSLEDGDPFNFPLISGIEKERIVEEPAFAKEKLFQALHWIEEYQTHAQLRHELLNEIHFEEDGSMLISIGEQGTEVRIGKRNFQKKIYRLGKIYEQLRRKKQNAKYVLLDNEHHPHHVTVKLDSDSYGN